MKKTNPDTDLSVAVVAGRSVKSRTLKVYQQYGCHSTVAAKLHFYAGRRTLKKYFFPENEATVCL